MTAGAFLLVRSHGSLWALPNEQVRAVEAVGQRRCQVRLEEVTVWVDEVLRLARGLAVLPVGETIRWAVPAGCRGLALCDQGPVVVVDGRQPPEVLTATPDSGSPEGNGEERDDPS
jgi:hypothetical protein